MRENGGGELIALKSSLQQEATPFTHTHTLTDGRTAAVCDILPFQSDDSMEIILFFISRKA
jgi:hypothetical protein